METRQFAGPLILLLILTPATPGSPALGQQRDTTEERNLAKSLTAQLVAAFNAHDTKALDALYAEDADVAYVTGEKVSDVEFVRLKGKREIDTGYKYFLECAGGENIQIKVTLNHARLITPELLETDSNYEVRGLPGMAGPLKGSAILLRRKQADRWLIVMERHIVVIPEPRP
jgi:ketosteroid isomerase-like protein